MSCFRRPRRRRARRKVVVVLEALARPSSARTGGARGHATLPSPAPHRSVTGPRHGARLDVADLAALHVEAR